MKSKYTAYTEAVYNEKDDGTYTWLGRVYNRIGPAKVLETQAGIAKNRADAVVQVKAWSTGILEDKYKAQEAPELVVITSKDVGNLSDILGV